MTKQDIVNEIATETGVEKNRIKEIVQMTFDRIVDVLATSGRLELRDFGVFSVRVSKPRKGRNPQTGASIDVASKRRVKFKSSQMMKARLNKLILQPNKKGRLNSPPLKPL